MRADARGPRFQNPQNAVYALTVLLALLAMFQAALVLGAPLGKTAWGHAGNFGDFDPLGADVTAA